MCPTICYARNSTLFLHDLIRAMEKWRQTNLNKEIITIHDIMDTLGGEKAIADTEWAYKLVWGEGDHQGGVSASKS